MPEQINGFSKGRKDGEEIIYIHDADGTVVTAEKNRNGKWSATAFVEGTAGEERIATGLNSQDEAEAALVEYMEKYERVADADAPKTVGDFEKTTDRTREIVYMSKSDETSVAATRNDGSKDTSGTWDARAFPANSSGSVQLAKSVGTEKAIDAMVEYMEAYDPDEVSSDSAGGGSMGEMMEQDGGALSGLSDAGEKIAAGVGGVLAPSDGDGDETSGSSVSGLFDEPDRDGPSALERLGEGGDSGSRSSPLFDMSDGDSGGGSVFEQFDDGGRSGSSPLFDMSDDSSDTSVFEQFDDSGRSGPSAFEKLGDDGSGSSLLDMDTGRDGPSAFEKLDDGGDGSSVFDQLE